MMERHLVIVNGRQVHYRRAGSGPPLILLHALPLASSSFDSLLVGHLAERATIIAPDLPGYGLSSTLDGESPSMDDYAEALGETLDALGCGRVDIAGVQVGALLALAFADRFPDRVQTLVLDSLPMIEADERFDLVQHYAPSLAPEWDGTYLVRAWSIRRDAHTFRPWYHRSSSNRVLQLFPSTDELYDEVLDLLSAGAEYPLPYQASFAYDAKAPLRRLGIPTWILNSPGEFGAGVGSSVSMPDNVQVLQDASLAECITAALDAPSGAPRFQATPPAPSVPSAPGSIQIAFAATSVGPLLVRRTGPQTGRPLVLFHASPGNSASLEPLARLLGASRPIIAFDTPGNGDSAPVPGHPTMADIAEVVGQALASLGVDEFDVFGAHTGALVALEVALQHGDRARHVVLDGTPIYSAEERDHQLAHHAPAMPLSSDGSHMIWAWHLIRDRALWAPWHNRTAQGASMPRIRAPFPSTEVLHERVLEFLKGARTYHRNYEAVFRYPTAERIGQLKAPTSLIVGQDSSMREKLLGVKAYIPHATIRLVPGMGLFQLNEATAQVFHEALDE